MKNPNRTVITAVLARSFNPIIAKTEDAITSAENINVKSILIRWSMRVGSSVPTRPTEFMIVNWAREGSKINTGY
jgi:hypothetical protein